MATVSRTSKHWSMSTLTYVNIYLVAVDTAVKTALVILTFKLFKFQMLPNKLNLLNAPHKKSHGVNFGPRYKATPSTPSC